MKYHSSPFSSPPFRGWAANNMQPRPVGLPDGASPRPAQPAQGDDGIPASLLGGDEADEAAQDAAQEAAQEAAHEVAHDGAPSFDPHVVWQMVLSELALQMPSATYDTWVRDTTVIAYEDGEFIIGSLTPMRDWA